MKAVFHLFDVYDVSINAVEQIFALFREKNALPFFLVMIEMISYKQ